MEIQGDVTCQGDAPCPDLEKWVTFKRIDKDASAHTKLVQHICLQCRPPCSTCLQSLQNSKSFYRIFSELMN